MAVVIETTIGDFTVDLYTEERPQTCRNFLKLCKLKYYNWNLFHTVQSNFIAQTGDPTGTGKGGESVYGIVLGEKARYYEAEQMPKIKHDRGGLLSMVNCGNNMLGSQFFITLAPHLQSLDGEHCVFGEIAEGLEIILKFNETICDGDHRPYQDIRISHTVILEDPFDDPKGFVVPDRSPEPTKEALMSDRIGADEIIDDTAGMTAEEIMEMQRDKEAKARATILEIVGDIPDAEMAPPENVLFVCKLNPVTTDDDLEIIFSRFGQIVGCEVIRDRQTGDSLQYAFIEFANRKSCEEAYFKMDNVLIDDRRIHVDFSQSVAKMRWRGKGKGIKYFDEKDEGTRDTPRRDNKGPKDLRKDNNRQDRNRDRGQREDLTEHRKHEKRKESVGNGGKYYIEKERYRDGRQEDSRERHGQDHRREKRRHERDDERRENRHRTRARSREGSRDRDKERASIKEKNSRARGSPERAKERSGRTKKEHRKERESDHKKEKRQAKDEESSSSSSSSESESDSSDKEPRQKRKEKRRRKDSDTSGSRSEEERQRSHKSHKRRKAKKHEDRRRKESSSSEIESEQEERQKNHKKKRVKDRSTEGRHKQKRR